MRRALCACLLALVAAGAAHATPVVYVPQGASWKYLDNGVDQGTAWRAPGFADGSWAVGAAELGYGDGDEATVVNCGACACPCNPKYTTTYVRHTFPVVDPAMVQTLEVSLLRDDGAVLYLNGSEIHRSNMPDGAIVYGTFAETAAGGAQETAFEVVPVDPGLLVAGDNVLAAEIHQVNPTSSDLSFDSILSGEEGPALPLSLLRGPYLQSGSPTSAVLRWRTNIFSVGRVRWGLDPGSLSSSLDGVSALDHEIELTGLVPDTRYYYSVGTATQTLAGGDSVHFFETAPPHGTVAPTRIWVIGDSGSANQVAADVRDDYLAFTGGIHTDVWLMLGDNAYTIGTDAQYQAAVFDMYPSLLRSTFLWSAFGNHDSASANSAAETGPYYEVFTLPGNNPNTGGMPSGTEAYYSFDRANIHFVVLDSNDLTLDPMMLSWAQADMASTTQPWLIAVFHHPPYSKGSHDSDNPADSGGRLFDMREVWLPILESAGVDLVLTGHSHVYERSMLIDGHYGDSTTFNSSHQVDAGDGCICVGGCPECPLGGSGPYVKGSLLPTAHEGTVYAVVGSSSKGANTGPQVNPHPVMVIGLNRHGSLVLDVGGARLDGRFLQKFGSIPDRFTILKGGDPDGDLVPTPDDNCAYTANASQLDSGRVSSPLSDSIGDSCQCGDVGDDGQVWIDDAARLARALALAGPQMLAPQKCNLLGPADPSDPDLDGVPVDCAADDLATLRAGLLDPGAGLPQACAPALP